jgi:HlyD family secretion protein
MKKKVIWIVAIVILIAGSILGVTLIQKGKGSVAKYRKEALARGDIEAVVVTSGTLNPIVLVDVGSQVSGKIVKLFADFNSQVKQGQIVAQLDMQPLKLQVEQSDANYKSSLAALERAKATLAQLKNQYERAQSLFDKKLMAYQDKETAEANYLGAKADVTSAEANLVKAKSQLDQSKVNLDYSIIRSPSDGIVINKEVNEGQTLQANFAAPVLFQVATDLTKMKCACSVDEADVGKVKEGQNVRFTVEAFPNEAFSGSVQQVQFEPQTVSNVVTYQTIVNVANPELKLRPGMTATVTIIVGEAKNVLRVPNSALRFTPTLTTAEMEKITKEAAERMQAQRQQQGGASGAPAASDPAGGQRAQAQAQGSQMGTRSGSGQGGTRRQASRVWVQDKAGKLHMIFVRPGITDNTYTEVLRAELTEGDEVLIGVAGPNVASSTTSQSSSRGGPPMFIGR